MATLLAGSSLPSAVPTAVSPLPAAEEQPSEPDDPGPASPVEMPDAEDRLGLAAVRGRSRAPATSPRDEEAPLTGSPPPVEIAAQHLPQEPATPAQPGWQQPPPPGWQQQQQPLPGWQQPAPPGWPQQPPEWQQPAPPE